MSGVDKGALPISTGTYIGKIFIAIVRGKQKGGKRREGGGYVGMMGNDYDT